MGQSTNAVLVYGYNLGGGEIDWLVEEANGEYGELQLDWFDEEGDDDFIEMAEKRLLQANGFTETYEDGREGYFGREREAKKALGVEFETYCSGDYPIYTIAAHVITVHQGDCKLLNLDELARLPRENGWDDKLTAVLRTLGLTPKQPEPAWLLVSYWG
ncbi:hypothetical protein [Actinomadura madurae]|uniref:hypothetical protein n=1 Tax=Actinomadura madurae TaxID=1993 RepID=UPI0020D2248B|nr:hypothetical protein [Actinomadura madurae]MCP9947226.1 hypothetical protein [Actinomadura madurae]MCP9963991.1 hypothetical protein [Actinomadura madurae]MCP9976466.1 hypothetical protein [Actinomadura madurae]MCQ0012040.1 hypothetical protein [Actinomadura madurae]MCQ0012659.1 hypothetical protein [Actinomadura madurae]